MRAIDAPGLKVVLLAPASVVHTQRWVKGLHARGVTVVLATQHDPGAWRAPEGVRVVRLRHAGSAGYFRNVPALRRLLREERPDLLNAHYASGYGTLAALARFRPWLLSVWGSDVHDFPDQSRAKGWLLRHNLRQADALASTSESMARQLRRLVPGLGEIAITPFGIDTARFAPRAGAPAGPGFVVGTVKTLAPKYGVDVLVRAYADFAAGLPPAARGASTLVVVGEGEQRQELEALARRLGIAAQVSFVGAVPHAEVPGWLQRFDVYVAASRLDSESFGVAVLEASACALPVVVSDAGGLPEVVVDGETGLVLPRGDVAAFARALRRLFDAPALRERMGRAGRVRVRQHYEWQQAVDRMLACYRSVAAGRGAAGARPAFASDTGADASASASASVAAGAGAAHDMRPAALSADTTVAGSRDGRGANAPRQVSVIVPCRNERAHVEAFCAGVWRQALPAGWRLELIVADGASDDGTAERLRALAANEPRLRPIDNPRRIVSTGLNLALAEARGEVIVRMDVHTEYAPDYVAECLAVLASTGADNVGGPWRARAADRGGPTQQAVAAAFQSRWVAGGALSRRIDHDGWVDTVYLGCWPRATFDRIGGFDEQLVRNQDDEHNLRLARSGGRVWQSSRIHSVYRPRGTLRQVFRQYLQYGYWKPFVMKKHGQAASARQFVPGAYVALQALLLLAALVGAPAGPALALLGAYLGAVVAMTWSVVSEARLGIAAALRVPGVIGAYHVGYGVGFLAGSWDVLRRRTGRARFASLSR